MTEFNELLSQQLIHKLYDARVETLKLKEQNEIMREFIEKTITLMHEVIEEDGCEWADVDEKSYIYGLCKTLERANAVMEKIK